ncbi:hypothetical protein HMPREF6745_2581, partial [Prevotella sp. oral taxon 472 str. F0295]
MPFLSKKYLAEDVTLGLWLLNEEEDFFFKNYPCLHDLQKKMTIIGSKHRRLEILAARALLFEMINNPDLHFNHNDSGKPLVEGYHVSVSHTKGMVALMLSKTREVAVDVEYESDRVGRIAHKFVNADETMPSNDHLLLAWCAKEAIFKYFSADNLLSSEIYLQSFDVEKCGVIVAKNTKR